MDNNKASVGHSQRKVSMILHNIFPKIREIRENEANEPKQVFSYESNTMLQTRMNRMAQHTKFVEFKGEVEKLRGWISVNILELTPKEMFSSLLNILNIPINEEEYQFFYKCIKELEFPRLKTKGESILSGLVIAIDGLRLAQEKTNQFISVLLFWFEVKNPKFEAKRASLFGDLQKTIEQYKKLKNEDNSGIIAGVIKDLKVYAGRLANKKTEAKKVGPLLREIFQYYAKESLMIGKNPTFDEIHKGFLTLIQGGFLKFCRDFSFMETNPRSNLRSISRKHCASIFHANSHLQREMSFEQFENAITQLATVYYDREHDQINSTSFKDLSVEEKLGKFRTFLGVGGNSDFQSKRRPSFSTHKKATSSLLLKKQYKETQQALQDWEIQRQRAKNAVEKQDPKRLNKDNPSTFITWDNLKKNNVLPPAQQMNLEVILNDYDNSKQKLSNSHSSSAIISPCLKLSKAPLSSQREFKYAQGGKIKLNH